MNLKRLKVTVINPFLEGSLKLVGEESVTHVSRMDLFMFENSAIGRCRITFLKQSTTLFHLAPE